MDAATRAIRHLSERYDPATGNAGDAGFPYLIETVAQAGIDPARWPNADGDVLSHAKGAWPYSSYLRIAHAAGTSGYDPTNLNGEDFVAKVRAGFQGVQFGDPANVNDDAWAILALRAAGVPQDDEQIQAAADYVRNGRALTGGWNYTALARRGETDITGMALAALAAAGRPVSEETHARAFLASERGPDGCYWGASKHGVQSTAWAIHAWHVLGDAAAEQQALDALSREQRADGGFPRTCGGSTSNPWATAEAALVLTGARYLLPGHAPSRVVLPAVVRAREPATLSLADPYARVEWRIDGAPIAGNVHAFDRAGAYRYDVYAEGERGRWRASGELTVLSMRPVAVAPSGLAALRREPVALGAGGSYDPDGEVRAIVVDWGDGNATHAPFGLVEHAYDLPGDYAATVRVVDDAGQFSAPAAVAVHVANRAPALSGLPAKAKTDRLSDVVLSPTASDPEGDPVEVAWAAPHASGAGEARLRFAALGNATVRFTARDPYGGEAARDVLVEVVNLPPGLANVTLPSPLADEPFTLETTATDADGPEPAIEWRVGPASGSGARFALALPAGNHSVLVTARDADNATATLRGTLVVRAPDAPEPVRHVAAAEPEEPQEPPRSAPSPLEAPAFDIAPASITVGEPAGFALLPVEGAAEYLFEFGDGKSSSWGPAAASHAWSTPGTYEVRATARAADGRASTATLLVTVAQLPPSPPPSPAPPLPQVTTTAPLPQLVQESARREAPAPALAPALALLLAALGTRARRGAR